MNVLGSLLQQVGWTIRLRRHGLRMRLRSLMTLLVVFGGIGTAIGYTAARRGVEDLPDGAADGAG